MKFMTKLSNIIDTIDHNFVRIRTDSYNSLSTKKNIDFP